MPHHTPLIATIVAGLVAAFLMGAVAQRLKISPVAGYLFAGVLVGPFTPGFVADTELAGELAELGVILLMFGVGLHFSLRDLLSVRRIAVPGAIVQIGAATAMGAALGVGLGWSLLSGIVFGLALSVASTVVLLRALEARNLVQTERGHIAVGWLIVEDLVMVLALVLLPTVSILIQGDSRGLIFILETVGLTLAKVVGFVVFMLVIGRRVIPRALHWVAHSGSRELFRIAVLAIALGVAFGAAHLFDVSFALGAFFAGMILGETQLSRRAAEETLPLRDAFAVLFFVSVGMLFDPAILTERPLAVVLTFAIIVVGKSIAALLIVRLFGYSSDTALTVAASLAQIGEFSFILAGLGVGLRLIPEEARDLILAGAILSILAHPFVFSAVVTGTEGRRQDAIRRLEEQREDRREEHVVLVGCGRVGSIIAAGLRDERRAFVVVEELREVAQRAAAAGYSVIVGNAADPAVLKKAGVESADKLLIAIPESYEAGAIAQHARAINSNIAVVARAHSEDEAKHLSRLGADHVIQPERETAARMLTLAKVLRDARASSA